MLDSCGWLPWYRRTSQAPSKGLSLSLSLPVCLACCTDCGCCPPRRNGEDTGCGGRWWSRLGRFDWWEDCSPGTPPLFKNSSNEHGESANRFGLCTDTELGQGLVTGCPESEEPRSTPDQMRSGNGCEAWLSGCGKVPANRRRQPGAGARAWMEPVVKSALLS